MTKRRLLYRPDMERDVLRWVGNCKDEEVDNMIDIIDETTPRWPNLSIKMQRRWVIYQLILREVVVNRGAISQEPNFQQLMTVFRMPPREIDRRLTVIYGLAKQRLTKQPAA